MCSALLTVDPNSTPKVNIRIAMVASILTCVEAVINVVRGSVSRLTLSDVFSVGCSRGVEELRASASSGSDTTFTPSSSADHGCS